MRIELKILNLLGNKYMLLFAGWFFSRVILSTLRTIIIGPFVFLPGFLILLYYLVLLTKKVYDNTHSQRQLIFITGIISDSILYWMIRAGTDSSFSLKSPWDNTIWIGSFTCLLFISFSFFLISRLKELIPGYKNKAIINTLILIFVPIIIVSLYRIMYLLTIETPNEERSLFILGTEIHHVILGSIILMICSFMTLAKNVTGNLFYTILISIAAGFILDQILYIQLHHVSDQAYGSLISWVGAVTGAIIYVVIVIIIHGSLKQNYEKNHQT